MVSKHQRSNQTSINLRVLEIQLQRYPREPATLLQRIALCQRAIEQVDRQVYPVTWAQLHFELGLCLTQEQSGDLTENLKQGIEHFQAAQEVYTPESHFLEWADSTYNLALLYERRAGSDRQRNLERALQLHQEILEADWPHESSPEQARSRTALGRLYLLRTEGDRAQNLETAIRHCRRALEEWTPDKHTLMWAETQDLLGTLHRRRLCGDPTENLEISLCYHQRALEVLDPIYETHVRDWARVQHNLGTALFHRIKGNRTDSLEQAIRHLEQALTVRTEDRFRSEWADSQRVLAAAYIEYPSEDRIQHAIELLQAVSAFFEQEAASVNLATTLSVLGNAYLRAIHGERTENIERAIHYYEKALQEQNWGPYNQDRAMTQHNLAVAYGERLRGERIQNLEQAAKNNREALDAIDQRDVIQWALIQTDMVDILWKLANLERQQNPKRATALMEDALVYGEQVVSAFEGQPLSHRLALAHYNLGNAYGDRLAGRRADNQDKAIEHYEQALGFYTAQNDAVRWMDTHNNLAVTYWKRVRGKHSDNITRAIDYFEQALNLPVPEHFPVSSRRIERNLGNLCFEETHWAKAVNAYKDALDINDRLYLAAATPEARQVELREIRDLPARLSYALFQTAAPGDGAPLRDAVLALEQNRARWLNDSLALHSQKPPDVPESVWQTFVTHRERIGQLQAEARLPEDTPSKRDYLTLSAELRAAYTALDETVTRIRGYDDAFMPDPTFAQILTAAESRHPVVYFAVTPAGTVALIVASSTVHPVWCDLTKDALRELIQGPPNAPELGGYLGAYATWRKSPNNPAARAAWFTTLDHTTHWLWDTLMGPLVQTLADLDIHHATLIPQGYLGLLPLHAAWTEDNGKRRYAMDAVCLTYAPNSRALSAARATAARVSPDCILAIDEPQPVSANYLPNANAEVFAVCKHFPQDHRLVLGGEAAAEQAVHDQLPHHTVLHFSCHGRANFAQPLDSGLLMAHDQTLTLRDILALRLENARLAVLSACETGIPGIDLPDEVISLPTGLAQAGIAGVVASLWSVSDSSTMMLMARFYELWKGDGLEPPAALRQAQFWVRDTTNGEKAKYLQTFLPISDAARPDENDFEHPFYWAAFTHTGV